MWIILIQVSSTESLTEQGKWLGNWLFWANWTKQKKERKERKGKEKKERKGTKGNLIGY